MHGMVGMRPFMHTYLHPRAHAQSGVVVLSVGQSSKFGADHDNEGSKHFYTSLKQ